MWARFPDLGRYLWIGGRSSRQEWWLIHFGCMAALTLNQQRLIEPARPSIFGLTMELTILLALLIMYVLFWISFTSIVRRLHDRNKRGWWAPLYVIPVFGWAWLFIECGFLPGRDRGNRFDPVPEPDTSGAIVQRARPPSKVLMIVTAMIAMGLLASTCMTVRITEVGTNKNLPVFVKPE